MSAKGVRRKSWVLSNRLTKIVLHATVEGRLKLSFFKHKPFFGATCYKQVKGKVREELGVDATT